MAAAKAGLNKEQESASCPRINEIPFQSERQFMATRHRCGGQHVVFVKGALEKLWLVVLGLVLL